MNKTKRKKIIIIALTAVLLVSIIVYLFPAFTYYQTHKIKDVNYEEGKIFCLKKTRESHPELAKKKYYYFSAWSFTCGPCIKEMPMQDDLADSLSQSIGFIHISDDTDEAVNAFLKKKQIKSRHFVFINDMNTFISAAYNNQKITNKAYPTHIVTDSIGTILFFCQGTLSYLELPKGKTLSKEEIAVMNKFKDPLVVFLEGLK